jgi:gamma-glutamyl hydrolase
MYDAAPPELDALLSRVNGLLFPGGAYPMEPVYEAFSKLVFKRAVQDKIPTWGTCLGQLQLLLYSSGRNAPGPISGGWDGMGPLMLPINLTAAGQHWQPIAELSEVTRHGIGHQQWAFHSHNWSVSVADFEQSPELNSTWEVLAADADRTGRTFVSLVRGRQLPFIGSIFHPEKAAYEYQLPKPAGDFRGSLPVHSAGAIDVMSHLGKFFVSTCRAFRSFAFSREEILRWNIHNWSPRYAAPLDSVFEEIYYFPAGGVPPPPEIAGASQALKPW